MFWNFFRITYKLRGISNDITRSSTCLLLSPVTRGWPSTAILFKYTQSNQNVYCHQSVKHIHHAFQLASFTLCALDTLPKSKQHLLVIYTIIKPRWFPSIYSILIFQSFNSLWVENWKMTAALSNRFCVNLRPLC